MTLFEHNYRGNVWRLEIVTYGGRTFANWRRWYPDGDTLKPTREGVTFPLERLSELYAALGGYIAETGLSGAQSAS